jgi:hypothetical protein
MTDRPADSENSSALQQDQIVAEKQIAALNTITKCRANLAKIRGESLNHARLDRWRVDTGRLIAETVSQREANDFLKKEVPATSTAFGFVANLSAISLAEYSSDRSQYLDALAVAIQEDPDFYFHDVVQRDLRREISPDADTVYVMYGDQTEALKLQKMLREYSVNAQLLGDNPQGTLTLIQMMEESCENFAFVFVILTNDEEVKDKKGKVEVRPRPNSLIELGYYLGRFGQKRVAVLCTHEIHDARPSDIDGVFVSLFRDSVSECTDFVLKQLGTVSFGPRAGRPGDD